MSLNHSPFADVYEKTNNDDALEYVVIYRRIDRISNVVGAIGDVRR